MTYKAQNVFVQWKKRLWVSDFLMFEINCQPKLLQPITTHQGTFFLTKTYWVIRAVLYQCYVLQFSLCAPTIFCLLFQYRHRGTYRLLKFPTTYFDKQATTKNKKVTRIKSQFCLILAKFLHCQNKSFAPPPPVSYAYEQKFHLVCCFRILRCRPISAFKGQFKHYIYFEM